MARIPAYRRIADILEKALRAGAVPPGAVIKVADVATLFESSRSPVRTAFEQLETKGLLRPRANHQGYMTGTGDAALPVKLTREMLGLEEDKLQLTSGNLQPLYYQIEHSLILHSISRPLRVNELAMARHFRSDRRSVRELLLRAESMGIVQRSSSRWEIVPFDAERCSNLYQVRMLLEPAALESAAPQIPPDVLEAMRERLVSAKENKARLTVEDVDMLEADMHRNALAFCPNREIPEILRRTIPTYVCGKYIQLVLRQKNEVLAARHKHFDIVDTFVTDHLEVIESIQAGRVADAAEALHRHLARSRLQILDMLSDYQDLVERPEPPPIFY